jgi:hypothetical protein
VGKKLYEMVYAFQTKNVNLNHFFKSKDFFWSRLAIFDLGVVGARWWGPGGGGGRVVGVGWWSWWWSNMDFIDSLQLSKRLYSEVIQNCSKPASFKPFFCFLSRFFFISVLFQVSFIFVHD